MFLALAQLVRLPNAASAWADIGLAWFVLNAALPGRLTFAELATMLLASTCFYWGGMVLNDVVDLAEDRRDRPQRPLPSGRVSLSFAISLATVLLISGTLLALVVSQLGPNAWIALALLAAILLYNLWAKRTLLGPWVMGACRAGNVLLLATAVAEPPVGLLVASGVNALYVVGVSIFARSETTATDRRPLLAGAVLMHLAAATAMGLAAYRSLGLAAAALLGFHVAVGRLHFLAYVQPQPSSVQSAVKGSLMFLICLDALLAFAFVGWPALGLLALLPCSWLAARWLYMT